MTTRSVMDIEGVARLTFDGRVALAGVTPHPGRRVQFSTLTGALVEVSVPTGWQVSSVSTHILYNNRDARLGFQQGQRGSALFNVLADLNSVHPDTVVSMQAGTLAHYKLDRGPDAVAGFTLWQGQWSDVYTFDHEAFDQALAAFGLVAPRDTRRGAVLQPPGGWLVEKDEATVDCNDVVLDLRRREEGTVPPWSGAMGAHVELYRMDEEGGWVLAASPTAVAVISTVPQPGDTQALQSEDRIPVPKPLEDNQIAALADGLDISWR